MEQFRRGELVFDVRDRGEGEPVVLLHGFPETAASWDGVSARLVEAGYRTLAPNQRGYSPSARPAGRRAYVESECVADVLALADAAGLERFHVVGHDFGANVAWGLAATHPDRLLSVTAVSVPHPAAYRHALAHSTQALRSWYVLAVQVPWLTERVMLAAGARVLRSQLRASGLGEEWVERFVAHMRQPGALTAALNWYRALPLSRQAVGPVSVPALYVWGAAEAFITRTAAYDCARHVTGSYRFEVLEGAGHWIPEEEPERLAGLVLDHLGAHAAG